MTDPRQELVQRLFQGTGETYDFMVNFATFGIDRHWKKKILAKVPPTSTGVLDLACGTGIVTFAIAERFPQCRVIGVDMTKEYLDVARSKATIRKVTNVEFIHQRAEEVSFNEPFDCVTASYLAKYANLQQLTQNVKGMLKENGLFLMHDFTYPSTPWGSSLWELYFKLLQTLGSRFYPKWRTIFYGLPDVVRSSTWVSELTSSLHRYGYTQITIERLILGAATIITAKNGESKGPSPRGSHRG